MNCLLCSIALLYLIGQHRNYTGCAFGLNPLRNQFQPDITLSQVIFTDLSKEDVSGSEGRIWLVCNVIGDGNYQALASDFQINKSFSRSDIAAKLGLSFRKPLGVAATEVTDYFNQTNKNIDGGDKEFMIPFLASGSDAETLETTFRKLTSEKREREVAKTGPGLWVSLKVLQGDLTSMQEGSKSHLVVGRPCIARKIGFPELILPNDVRNDLYVNVYSAELTPRLSKTADCNVEVVELGNHGSEAKQS